jgi:hypothetical protein
MKDLLGKAGDAVERRSEEFGRQPNAPIQYCEVLGSDAALHRRASLGVLPERYSTHQWLGCDTHREFWHALYQVKIKQKKKQKKKPEENEHLEGKKWRVSVYFSVKSKEVTKKTSFFSCDVLVAIKKTEFSSVLFTFLGAMIVGL